MFYISKIEMTYETIDERKERRALELQKEYIYLKAKDWWDENKYNDFTEIGFEQ